MIPKVTVEMVNDARDEIDNVFKLNNSELSIIPRSQRETRDIINYALDRLNGEIMDKVFKESTDDELDSTGFGLKPIGFDKFKALYEGTWEVSKEEYDLNDKRKRERIEEEKREQYLKSDDDLDLTGFGLKPTEEEEITKKCGPGEKPLFVGEPERVNPKVPMINAVGSFILVKESDVDSYMLEGCKRYSDVYNQYLAKEEEPELNEEAISKLCDDLIEAKKEPLSAAQIIDKYARRD